ncbi:MAG: threonylcarbamoyl-AMP synthase [Gemmatimonadetes bacterium]|nr:L-threonylcarbamoyladenylate synthase [Gemmatimonadota bacterium]NIQ60173.1 L-threonylcarbamoyladenylate synthase [Gemmatimonadota bacterium]NIU80390.1 threonylcarbamoyl-AMP synthase [Gammaproteobacteria bacterium]NIX48733.1 threonylcarbamoyl-AMP synthase [Gemmatimonadota bacterium]NIY13191.1 threonylcarbamoyl-AMP synthase [Gemmatimonadota bacterium]
MSERLAYGTPEERAAAAGRLTRHLADDGLVVYPTETVYGIGCALRPEALRRLADFKGGRPFLLLIRGRDDAGGLIWTPAAERLAHHFWPGPLTIALRSDGRYPPQVVGPEGAVAVRVSPHPAIPAILAAADGPVTSTSANRPGRPPARTAGEAAELTAELNRLLVLDGGELPPASPSTIVECAGGPRVIREGAISRLELESVVELE